MEKNEGLEEWKKRKEMSKRKRGRRRGRKQSEGRENPSVSRKEEKTEKMNA